MIPLIVFLLACVAVYLGTILAAFSALMRFSLRMLAESSAGSKDLLTTFLEFGFHQADIQKHGEYFSTAFILLGNIMFVGMMLGVLVYGDFGDVPGFLVRGMLKAFQ